MISAPARKRSLAAATRAALFCFLAASLLILSPLFFAAHAQDASTDPLPDAPGKQLVLTKCTVCHDESRFDTQRLSADDWDQVITTMTTNGLEVTDDEYNTILNYLSKNLGIEPVDTKINVNKATADDLQKGLELTDTEAAAIVKYRTDHGDFKDWHEVASVAGVDPKKIEAKKDSLTF